MPKPELHQYDPAILHYDPRMFPTLWEELSEKHKYAVVSASYSPIGYAIVRSNGPKGGNHTHGSRTEAVLNLECGQFKFEVLENDYYGKQSLCIRMAGDQEPRLLADMFRGIADALDALSNED